MIDISATIEDAIHNNQTIRLLRIKDVCHITSISRSHIYLLASQGKFPKSVPLVPGGTSKAWVKSEVEAWVEGRIAAREEV